MCNIYKGKISRKELAVWTGLRVVLLTIIRNHQFNIRVIINVVKVISSKNV